ncbi:hypothetical protein SAMN05428969_1083 [Devosia sp. YR412]|uniref:hypothetical protein n=1 Tax=Devosia sp. YR412 TaxID=1881030 RepID=UPI0008C17AE0|nr:hypothetical protein [Devosia sp. YR412]SEP82696.1 hypothetical protein SAMN05428969_1083 [Devosia sp. YR412]
MISSKALIACAIIATAHMLAPQANAQSRLPPSVSATTFTLGLMLGCVVRAQTYLEVSRANLAAAGLDLPPTYGDLDLVIGVHTAPFVADLNQALSSLSGSDYNAALQDKLISDIARLEYGSPYGGAAMYNESWGQMAACGYQFHIHGIYAAYPPTSP